MYQGSSTTNGTGLPDRNETSAFSRCSPKHSLGPLLHRSRHLESWVLWPWPSCGTDYEPWERRPPISIGKSEVHMNAGNIQAVITLAGLCWVEPTQVRTLYLGQVTANASKSCETGSGFQTSEWKGDFSNLESDHCVCPQGL